MYDKRYLRRVVELRRSDVYERAVSSTLANSEVVSVTGIPCEAGLPTGGITDLSSSSRIEREVQLKYLDVLRPFVRGFPPPEVITAYAHFAVPFTGPHGAAKLVVVATKSGETWRHHCVQAQLQSGRQIDLLLNLD